MSTPPPPGVAPGWHSCFDLRCSVHCPSRPYPAISDQHTAPLSTAVCCPSQQHTAPPNTCTSDPFRVPLSVLFRTHLVKAGVFAAMGSALEGYDNPMAGEHAAGTLDELSLSTTLTENQVCFVSDAHAICQCGVPYSHNKHKSKVQRSTGSQRKIPPSPHPRRQV